MSIAEQVEKIIVDIGASEGNGYDTSVVSTPIALAIEKYILDRKPNLFNSIGSGELHIKEIALNEWQSNLEEGKSEV